MSGTPVKLNAQQVVNDIRHGCDDATLMGKYELSPGQLEKLFKKLLDLGLVKPTDLAARKKELSEQGYIHLEADDPVEARDTSASKETLRDAKAGGEKAIRSHLPFAIFCLLWFFPLGIVATVHASRVKKKLKIGDTEGALDSSKAAKRWCWISVLAAAPIVVPTAVLALWILLASSSPGALPFINTLF